MKKTLITLPLFVVVCSIATMPVHSIDFDGGIQHHCFLSLGQTEEQQNHVSDEKNGSRCGTDRLNGEYDCHHSVTSKPQTWETSVHCDAYSPCTATQSHLCSQPNGVKYTSTKTLTCPSAQNNIKSDAAGTSCYTGEEGTNSYSVTAYAPPC